jgi:hypothetical protein
VSKTLWTKNKLFLKVSLSIRTLKNTNPNSVPKYAEAKDIETICCYQCKIEIYFTEWKYIIPEFTSEIYFYLSLVKTNFLFILCYLLHNLCDFDRNFHEWCQKRVFMTWNHDVIYPNFSPFSNVLIWNVM